MKKIISIVFLTIFTLAAFAQENIITLASFRGTQVTGVTVTDKGRVFANFPRWRTGVPFSVVEVLPDGSSKPYPSAEWNGWEVNKKIQDNQFVAVQSVVAHKDKLYVLETGNPLFKGLVTQPKIYVIDLKTDQWVDTYIFPSAVVKNNSYVNDLRVDEKKQKLYFTDSGEAGIIIYDIKTKSFTRVLENHPITKAETDHLTFNGQVWKNTVHSDGIEYDADKDLLYVHALTGYTLYGLKVKDLLNPKKASKIKPLYTVKTAAPDGLGLDAKGNIYFADLENNKIQYLAPDRKTIKTLVEGDKVKWADTFSIHNGYLYYTNSRINEAGGDISQLIFTINKVALPAD